MKEFIKTTKYHNQEKQKEQSKNWLSHACLTLLENQIFSEITISQICQEAELSRRTFYRLFTKKEELITYQIEKLCFQYRNLFVHESDLRLPNVTKIFFKFWSAHKNFLLLLRKNHLELLLVETFSKLLPEIYLDPNLKPIDTDDQLSRYYIAIFCSGGYATLLLHWLNHDCADTPEFMQRTIQELVHMNK